VTVHDTIAGAAADARDRARPGLTILCAPFFPTTPEERGAFPRLVGVQTNGV
jgi:hypothetical protein